MAKKTTPRKKSAPKKALRKRLPAALPEGDGAIVLDRLWAVVTGRRAADPAVSHSARLLARGTAKVAQKFGEEAVGLDAFGEEAVECLIEAVSGNRTALIGESADVLYHLIVMWVDAGVAPEEIWAELVRREGVSGIVEKASRAREVPMRLRHGTRKIP
jgi:phosphoribosyl-ATP pyrophosphohydrolase